MRASFPCQNLFPKIATNTTTNTTTTTTTSSGSSVVGDILVWKNAQKNDTKNKISDTSSSSNTDADCTFRLL
jgi:hypothetical protein